MTAADKIQAARALIEPLTGHTPGKWRLRGPEGVACMNGYSVTAPTPEGPGFPTPSATGEYCMAYPPPHGSDRTAVQKANAALIASAPALRDTVAALTDLADAQAQENAKLKSKLARYAIHEEYDCPGDTPEFCGWLCSICGEHVEENGSGHLNDCVIRDHNQHGTSTRSPEVAQ